MVNLLKNSNKLAIIALFISFLCSGVEPDKVKIINESLQIAATKFDQALEDCSEDLAIQNLSELREIYTKLNISQKEFGLCFDSMENMIRQKNFETAKNMWTIFCDAIKQPIDEIAYLEEITKNFNKEGDSHIIKLSKINKSNIDNSTKKFHEKEEKTKYELTYDNYLRDVFVGWRKLNDRLNYSYIISDDYRDSLKNIKFDLKNKRDFKSIFSIRDKFSSHVKSKYALKAEQKLQDQEQDIDQFYHIEDFMKGINKLKESFGPNSKLLEFALQPYDYVVGKLNLSSLYINPTIQFLTQSILTAESSAENISSKLETLNTKYEQKIDEFQTNLSKYIDSIQTTTESKKFSLISMAGKLLPEYLKTGYYKNAFKDILTTGLTKVTNNKNSLREFSTTNNTPGHISTNLHNFSQLLKKRRLDYCVNSLSRKEINDIISSKEFDKPSKQQFDKMCKEEELENFRIMELLNIEADGIIENKRPQYLHTINSSNNIFAEQKKLASTKTVDKTTQNLSLSNKIKESKKTDTTTLEKFKAIFNRGISSAQLYTNNIFKEKNYNLIKLFTKNSKQLPKQPCQKPIHVPFIELAKKSDELLAKYFDPLIKNGGKPIKYISPKIRNLR